MKKNLAKIKVFLTVSTWNLALENWGPQQGDTILTIHKHSSAPRTTIFHIISNIPSRISLTLASVPVVTLRKISPYFSWVAGGSIFQEYHLIRRILHRQNSRKAAEKCTGTAQVTTICTVIYPEQLAQRSQKKCVLLRECYVK